MESTDAPFEISLIRHGETDWNRSGHWQGQADVSLNAAGRAQAARLARRLKKEGVSFDALYSSDLSRALETARAVGGALGLTPAAAPALREIDLGTWSGFTVEEISRDDPEAWAMLEAGEDIPRGGAETFAIFMDRIRNWLELASRTHAGQKICAVTHGGCIRAVLLHVHGLNWAERHQVPGIANTSLTTLRKSKQRWEIVAVNQVATEDGSEPPSVDADEGKLV